jgi:glycosyltransferase involved in cell wall biosynthesis
VKVLYISPYLGFSGYSTAARGYVRALHQKGVEVVLRNVKYDDGQEHKLEPWERALFCRAAEGVDVIVQHLTPNEMAVKEDGSMKHIGVLATETDLISKEWAESLNRMDAVVTFCEMSSEAIQRGGVRVPVYVLPHTFDIKSYEDQGDTFDTMTGVPLSGADKPCIFYNISQVSNKKGIDRLLRAYYGAFQKKEPVTLILKGYIGQMKRVGEDQQIIDFVNTVREGCRFKQFPPVVIFTDIMTEDEIKRIHSTGDIYVNASSGEGWGLPLFDAAAYGNGVVSTIWGGPEMFLKSEDIYHVQHTIEPVFGMNHPHPYMFTSNEKWAEPSVQSMITQMRLAFDDYCKDQLRTVPNLEAFDDSVVGEQFKTILEEVCNG